MKLATTKALQQIGDTYAALPKRPLRVTAFMDGPVITYTKSIHFDGLLAHTVVMRATEGAGLPNGAVYALPIPLGVLWRDENGLPLWATTDLVPVSEDVIASRDYFHRRSLEPTMTTRNLDVGTGRHKEKRSPLPTLTASVWQADVIGHPETLLDLLSSATSIGKKNSTHGAVQEWRIDELETFYVIDESERARRVLPVSYIHPDILADFNAGYLGWTPPYWLPQIRTFCYDLGQQI